MFQSENWNGNSIWPSCKSQINMMMRLICRQWFLICFVDHCDKYSIPYLFGYKPRPQTSYAKNQLDWHELKCIILGYKPRAILGLDFYYRPWNFHKNTIEKLYSKQENECKRLETNKRRDREVMNIKQLKCHSMQCLGGGGYSLIWAIQGRATGQGMVFWPRRPKQGVQFDLPLS